MLARKRLVRGNASAVKFARGGEAVIKQRKPGGGILSSLVVHELPDGLRAVGNQVVDFEEREAAEAHAGLIDQLVGVREMAFERGFQSGQGNFVKAEQKFLSRGRGENFIKEYFQGGMRNSFQTQRRLAHFTHATAQHRGVFGAKMRVQAESHLEIVNRLSRDARGEDLVQAFESVMIALQARDALLDRQSGTRHFLKRAEAREHRQVPEGLVRFHGD